MSQATELQSTALAQKEASGHVARAHAALVAELPFADTQDFEDAARGFIGSIPDALVPRADGKPAWTLKPYEFQKSETPPPTVNPSLWRQCRLNLNNGLFQVCERIYQVRGLDIANMTIVEGDSGIIVIDTLTSAEGSRAALELHARHRGKRPVSAIIYTHTHTDHWGGSRGVLSEEEARSGKVPVIAPNLFMEHAASENVIAGNAMLRRAMYQFGRLLPIGPKGQVDAGLGKNMAIGTVGLIPPTDLIMTTGDRRTIDGIEFVFQMAPETEAPAEMHIYIPQLKALNLAENATHNFHNLLPFRGAQVRDPLAWSKYINEAIEMWGAEAEVLMGQHHWPVWGNARVKDYMRVQRDLYKYVHDQTIRLMNQGLNAQEIAETLELPRSIAHCWHARGYYGAVRHNAKAIYQRYLGWYDGNPANLDPLPPVATGNKLIEYMGGVDAAVSKARADFAKGEFRFVAQVMSHAVFADPGHEGARALLADTFEQLGYLTESATWRNAYLFGAYELRNGMPNVPGRTPVSPDTMKALRVGQFFDSLAVRLNGPKADGKRIVVNWSFTDTGERYVLTLENATLNHVAGNQAPDADVALTLTRGALNAVMARQTTLPEAVKAGAVKLAGNGAMLVELMSLIDENTRMFEIVEPKKSTA